MRLSFKPALHYTSTGYSVNRHGTLFSLIQLFSVLSKMMLVVNFKTAGYRVR